MKTNNLPLTSAMLADFLPLFDSLPISISLRTQLRTSLTALTLVGKRTIHVNVKGNASSFRKNLCMVYADNYFAINVELKDLADAKG